MALGLPKAQLNWWLAASIATRYNTLIVSYRLGTWAINEWPLCAKGGRS
jgi:hypothetical protein